MWESISTWFLSVDWFAVLCWMGAISSIVAGLAGTIVPALPGLPLIAVGAALIAWAGHFEVVGWSTVIVIAILAIIGVVVDTVAQSAGAQKAGASAKGIWGSVLGTFAGVFVGGLVGILIFPLIGAFVGEFLAKRDLLHAGRVGVATWIGMVVGTAAKVALAFMMVGILIWAYLV